MYKIDILLKQNQKLFHTNDLAILWGIDNRNTLYTAIKRYVAKGVLVPVQKGLYATVLLDQLDPSILGDAVIHTYSYISCETVLARAGVLFQAGEAMTFVSSFSRRFVIASHVYIVRKLADRFLFQDTGILRQEGVLTATTARAVADMRYFHPAAHFDNPRAIDWKTVRTIQKEVGYI
ncbi:hypothetical protein A2Z00_04370 [Candidatus Gottesmanbacteria bacterium RBG_13_45_10]|uniref:AbiEi antitoxin C-terminal domain-containing protein n=1 Tax=Candidatus Gottesmanbacteria bacterium RBG_13_45_10 TaxID=1798370 RepID=A0A1F5ZIJ8_9BACT|nr:MAG: hypothetical protein A2Z00_04370 [Candidatus Gottesmanbacteria bacterium RBG_13_45_10]